MGLAPLQQGSYKMANAKRKKAASAPTSVTLRYELGDLPTAQHRAGLAGLLLQTESMTSRGLPHEAIPRVQLTSATCVEATFTKESLCALFDDLYDAKLAVVESRSKWPRATPVEEKVSLDQNTGKMSKTYMYQVVRPRGHFLRQFTDDGKEAWHKLWRDMLWAIPRGKPTTRIPFNNRAAGKGSGEGEAMWKGLSTLPESERNGDLRTCDVAGAVLLGAQAVNAEAVPFCDRVDHAVLLHFWQLTARIFVPEQVAGDGSREFVGFVLAVPDVSDLSQFTRRYKRSLERLTSRLSRYYPAEAVVSLPAESALEFMDGLARLTQAASSEDWSDVARALAGVEFFHMVKAGNNVKTMTHGRITATPDILTKYEVIRETCRNPVFRAARLLALLRDEPRWYVELAAPLAQRPWSWFVHSNELTPKGLPSFARDVTRKFHTSLQTEQNRRTHAMTTGSTPLAASLETLVYRLVRTYVRAKTEQRSGITYTSFKENKVKDERGRERVDYPRAYTEAREKVCSDLFLGLRSRRDDDFVSYFTGTIGSVAQGPNLSAEGDFRVIAQALLDDNQRRDVQTLAMLAVAAASYSSTRAEEEDDSTSTGNAQ
jgi:CRISPR-associated protein Cmx8